MASRGRCLDRIGDAEQPGGWPSIDTNIDGLPLRLERIRPIRQRPGSDAQRLASDARSRWRPSGRRRCR